MVSGILHGWQVSHRSQTLWPFGSFPSMGNDVNLETIGELQNVQRTFGMIRMVPRSIRSVYGRMWSCRVSYSKTQ